MSAENTGASNVYLDTSVVLRFILNQNPILKSWGHWGAAFISELGGVEARRVFDRMRLTGALDDEGVAASHEELAHFESSVATVELSRRVLSHASAAMPTVVRTLDTIHLATAMLIREYRAVDLAFATHDEQQGKAARALGFQVVAA
ncbi:MAG: type II toxin-antitoxin system VapC family toxin [Myxococcota bacterium]